MIDIENIYKFEICDGNGKLYLSLLRDSLSEIELTETFFRFDYSLNDDTSDNSCNLDAIEDYCQQYEYVLNIIFYNEPNRKFHIVKSSSKRPAAKNHINKTKYEFDIKEIIVQTEKKPQNVNITVNNNITANYSMENIKKLSKKDIQKRLFWTDFSINIVLDTLCKGLYDSVALVRMKDGTAYIAKDSKKEFAKGIDECVKQTEIKDITFEPNKVIDYNSLYVFATNLISGTDDGNWIFAIFINKKVYDSFFKIKYSAYEPADCLPHQVIDYLLQNVKNYFFYEHIDEAHIAVENNPADVIRHAGSSVVNAVAMCMLDNTNFSFSLAEAINKISYLTYEKKIIGNNGILFAKRTRPSELEIITDKINKLFDELEKLNASPNLDDVNKVNALIEESDNIQTEINSPYTLPGDEINVDYILSYKEPVLLNDSRHIRKLLETTSDDCFLISDSDAIFGLGKKREESKGNYCVKFYDYGKWAFFLDDDCILQYENGMPHLPKVAFDKKVFREKFLDCFGNNPNMDKRAEEFCSIIESAVQERTGAIIVINDKAEEECNRLSKQSTPIMPIKLDKDNIKKLTKIDGAVMVNPEINCFSFGVILDGMANSKIGTPSRGSRYNSSYRYYDTRTKEGDKLLVVVISDDGMVDIIG